MTNKEAIHVLKTMIYFGYPEPDVVQEARRMAIAALEAQDSPYNPLTTWWKEELQIAIKQHLEQYHTNGIDGRGVCSGIST